MKRCFGVAYWRRHLFDQFFEDINNPLTTFGTTAHCIGRFNTDNIFNFVDDFFWLGLWQIHLIKNRYNLKSLGDRRVTVGHGLGFDTLRSVYNQQRTLTGRQRARHFIGKVNVAWRINKVQLVSFPIQRGVRQGNTLRFNGNATLSLDIHRIENLGGHFSL